MSHPFCTWNHLTSAKYFAYLFIIVVCVNVLYRVTLTPSPTGEANVRHNNVNERIGDKQPIRAKVRSIQPIYAKYGNTQPVQARLGKVQPIRKEKCHTFKAHVSRWEPSLRTYPAGVACLCDWILTPNAFYGNVSVQPKVVYVATRALYKFDGILDSIKEPFVLVTAINDETIPINTDVRIPLPMGFTGTLNRGLWPRLINHPKIIHWFAENHSRSHPKMSTLPIGLVSTVGVTQPDEVYAESLLAASTATEWSQRRTLILSSDRIRTGDGQWRDRSVAHKLCSLHPLCEVAANFSSNITEQTLHENDIGTFYRRVADAKFLVMVHGGGLDPCPKLFQSIIVGTIPIIESTALDDAYAHLPVAIVPSIAQFLSVDSINNTMALLANWTDMYAPYYVMGSALRNETLHKLSQEYWWSVITARLQKTTL